MKFIIIKIFVLITLLSSSLVSIGQKVENPDFEKRIEQLISHDIPIVTVEFAQENCSEYIFLDARELEEYTTSHIPNSRYIGYDNFNLETVVDLSKDQKIIIYCSIGYRSEKIGKKLKAEGFTEVYNLYGSIFEWANRGYSLVDNYGNSTQRLHTYNKKWSKWVDHPEIIKKW